MHRRKSLHILYALYKTSQNLRNRPYQKCKCHNIDSTLSALDQICCFISMRYDIFHWQYEVSDTYKNYPGSYGLEIEYETWFLVCCWFYLLAFSFCRLLTWQCTCKYRMLYLHSDVLRKLNVILSEHLCCVSACSNTNLALNRPTWQSSDLDGHSHWYNYSNAVDGNRDPYFPHGSCMHTTGNVDLKR